MAHVNTKIKQFGMAVYVILTKHSQFELKNIKVTSKQSKKLSAVYVSYRNVAI